MNDKPTTLPKLMAVIAELEVLRAKVAAVRSLWDRWADDDESDVMLRDLRAALQADA